MRKSVLRWVCSLMFAILFFGMGEEVYGQDKVRKYATRQHDFSRSILGFGGKVINETKVVNLNPQEGSTLSFTLGALGLTFAEQVVDFKPTPSAATSIASPRYAGGTPVFVKISLPSSLLGVLTGVEIQAITNLHDAGGLTGWTYTNVGTPYTGANLLSLLSGAGDSEIMLVPVGEFQGIRVKLSSTLGLNGSCSFFHAYVHEDALLPLSCDERNNPIDILSGVRSASIGALTSLGGVDNPYNLINSDQNDFATMNVGVGALNTVFLNTVFSTDSKTPQVVKIILDQPSKLLDLSLLGSFTIQPYSRGTPIGSPISANDFLKIRLLPGTEKYELSIKINDPFDRVEIRLNNTVNLLTSLRIYNVSRHESLEILPEFESAGSLSGCEQVNLADAIANYDNVKYNYMYYDREVGGTALSSIVTESGTYYIQAIEKTTGCNSLRLAVLANVLPLPGKPHLTISDVIN